MSGHISMEMPPVTSPSLWNLFRDQHLLKIEKSVWREGNRAENKKPFPEYEEGLWE
jgi:hypothetical protein